MTMNQVCMLLLALAVFFGATRYLVSVWRCPASQRPKLWRIYSIIALQLMCAVLLYFTLFPPATFTSAERLVILTADSSNAYYELNGRVLALPEAPDSTNTERIPDLATALRRYPGVKDLQIVGMGLSTRDQEAARGFSIGFSPSPLPKALVELSLPDKVSSGARWAVRGRVNQINDARIELLDPGNAVVAGTQVDPLGNFALGDVARAPGVTMYQLRILDAQKKILETVKLPLIVLQDQPLKVLSLSGGPNPELKYLRRWAVDAGVQLQSQVNLSVGVQLNNDAVAIDSASLRETDLLILDERAWSAMNRNNKQTVIDALRNGMGLLLRITGPLTANDRAELRALGFTVSDANIVQGVRLKTDDDKKNQPTLARRPLRVSSSDAVTLLQDDTNNPLALWRAEGRGRIGVIWLTDSYKLVLGDEASSHGQIWGNAASTLARTRNAALPYLRDTTARINEITVLCNISAKTYVQEPDSKTTCLLIDNIRADNKNCAAFWPHKTGWHLAVSDSQQLPFYVRDSDEAPGLKANALREATLLLTARQASEKNTSRIPVPGLPWPWFSVWLLVTAALWLLERSKLGVHAGRI
ncbi:MAG: hypothetical protein ACREPB_10365 [Arenimonas sp.]